LRVNTPVATNWLESSATGIPEITSLAVPGEAVAKSVTLCVSVTTPALLPVTVPKLTSAPVGLGLAGTSLADIADHAEKSIGDPPGLNIGAVEKACFAPCVQVGLIEPGTKGTKAILIPPEL
jgi:hypothetical protein